MAMLLLMPMPLPLFFSISGGEIIIVLLFVLMFFGSKGLPDMARTLGRTMRQVRDASNEVQREIQRGANEVRREVEQRRMDIERSATQEAGKDDPGKPPTSP
jgi:sec-independent protein translocase protein TatA